MQQHDLQVAEQLHRQYQALLTKRQHAQQTGLPALVRLTEVAQRSSGQSAVVGRFLLGLYNGPQYPFELTDLRRLDAELHQDCLAVLELDWQPAREVHEYVDNGDRIWRGLAERWGRVGA